MTTRHLSEISANQRVRSTRVGWHARASGGTREARALGARAKHALGTFAGFNEHPLVIYSSLQQIVSSLFHTRR